MAEYIEKDKAINTVFEAFADGRSAYIALEAIPAADVAPVRHGRWIQHYEPYDTGEEWIEAPYGFECSECGRWEAEKEPFCNCGAKMDGGEP